MDERSSPDSDAAVAADVVAHSGPLLHDADGAVADPLSPAAEGVAPPAVVADEVVTGDSDIRTVLGRARHVFVHRPDQLVPVCLTPDEARLFLRRAGRLPDPIVVTARVRGPDLVVRTLQYLGHPTLRGRAPASLAGSAAASEAPSRPPYRDPLRGLGRTVARVGRVTRKRPAHALLVVSRRVPRPYPSRVPNGVTALDAPDDTGDI